VPGRFTVTGEYKGKTDTATVLVLPPSGISRIYLDPIEQNARSGDLVTFGLFAGYESDSAIHLKNAYFIAGDEAGRQNVSYTYFGQTVQASIIVVTDQKILKVIFDPDSLTLTAGETATFRLKAVLEDETEVFIRNIDFIDTDPGSYTIAGRYAGEKAAADITVVPVVVLNKISLKPLEQTVKPGATVRFNLHAEYSDGSTTLVKPVEFNAGDLPGKQTVTHTHQGQTASATIFVEEEIKLVEVILLPENQTIKVDETTKFELIAKYSNGTREKIKSVSFTGEKAGTFTLTEKHEGTTAAATVLVEEDDPGFSSAGGETLLLNDTDESEAGFNSVGGTTSLVEESN
jgi:plastocyanin